MKHATTILIAVVLVFGITMQYAAADNPLKGSIKGLRSIGTSRLLQNGINRVSRNSGRSFKLPNVSNSIRNGSRSGIARGWERLSTNGNVTEGLRRLNQGGRGLENLGRLSQGSRGREGLGRLGRGGRSHEGFGRNGTPGINAFGEMLRGFENYSDYGRGRIPSYGYSDRHHHGNDEMADAYRDAAIANAVVGLVGVLVSAAQQPQYPQYTAVATTPVQAALPAGHWERQRVVVQPEHYETYQEWIPELYDSRTGQKIGGGYYETRTRRIPATFQEKDVWVGP